MAMKRANGTGSVYKLKHKNLRKPYRAVITAGWTAEGKPIKRSLGTFAKQADAYQALAQFASNPDAFAERKMTTFGQVFDWTIDESKRQGLSKGRIQHIEIVRDHFAHLLSQDITTLRVPHVQSFFDDPTRKQSYLQSVKAILVRVMNVGIKHEVLTKNYMRDIIISKNAPSTRIAKVFTPSHIITLWEHKNERTAQILLLYIYTGLRISELYGIKIEDVHLKERYMIGGSKTDAGKRRIIPIAECIYPIVSAFYSEAQFNRSNRLFKSPSKTIYRTHFTKICQELNLGEHVPHDTRHTFITMCSNAEIPEIIVKHIVGHSTASNITQDIYTHKTTNQYVEAVNKLPTYDDLIKGEPRVSYRNEI